ncbi:MAG: GAF and ANTAR domain-containing protein [Pseudolysinimonas sp.]
MTDEGARLCDPFLEALPVTGASISVFDIERRQSTICVSDDVAARLDELQLELGEGPHWDALRTARPVIAMLGTGTHREWPVFADAALDLGAAALFSFPMFLGAVTVGVVDLYSARPELLDPSDVALAARLTARTTRRAVHHAVRGAADHDPLAVAASPAMRREVHQATGMILVQLNTTASEAFFRLRAYAFASSRTMQEVAHDVITGSLDFGDLRD